IWVLTQPNLQQPSTGRLLFVDTTGAHTAALSNIVGAAWRAYLSGHDSETPGAHRTVPAIDLLDDHADLTPRRYLPQTRELAPHTAQTIARITAFDHLANEARLSLPTVRKAKTTALSTAPQASLADLIRAGSISVRRTAARTRISDTTMSDRPLTSTAIV